MGCVPIACSYSLPLLPCNMVIFKLFCIKMLVWEELEKEMGNPTPVLLPGEFHRQRSLVGYSPWGCECFSSVSTLALLYMPSSSIIFSLPFRFHFCLTSQTGNLKTRWHGQWKPSSETWGLQIMHRYVNLSAPVPIFLPRELKAGPFVSAALGSGPSITWYHEM